MQILFFLSTYLQKKGHRFAASNKLEMESIVAIHPYHTWGFMLYARLVERRLRSIWVELLLVLLALILTTTLTYMFSDSNRKGKQSSWLLISPSHFLFSSYIDSLLLLSGNAYSSAAKLHIYTRSIYSILLLCAMFFFMAKAVLSKRPKSRTRISIFAAVKNR